MTNPNLADDLLEGAAAIAEFMFGSKSKRRKVYALLEKKYKPEPGKVKAGPPPIIRVGWSLQARKSSILAWFAEQERKASGQT